MNQICLSDLLRWIDARCLGIPDCNLREASGELALSTFKEWVYKIPGLVNVAALWLCRRSETAVPEPLESMNSKALVASSSGSDFQKSLKNLFHSSFLLESQFDKPLFGTTYSLGGYFYENKLFLITLDLSQGLRVGYIALNKSKQKMPQHLCFKDAYAPLADWVKEAFWYLYQISVPERKLIPTL